jgi:probable HAF family extracellular repeat protein
MQSLRKYVAAIVLFVMMGPIELTAQKTVYTVKDLGTLGGTAAVAEDISERGWVVGSANLTGDQNGHAFLWRDGITIDLGTLGGLNSQEQWPVNDNQGVIVGSAETSAEDPLGEDFCGFDSNSGVPPTGLICLGFVWQDGIMTALPTLGGNNGQAVGVNNRGQIVGFAETAIQDPLCIAPQVLDVDAVLWGPRAGQIRILPPLAGDLSAWATGINDSEQVVGLSGNCGSPNFNAVSATVPQHGVIWQNGTVTNLGNLGGTLATFPFAINSKGQVVGQAYIAGDIYIHTFLWEKGTIADLGVVPSDVGSGAFGLNDQGEVVGGSCGPNVTVGFGCRGYLWRRGVMVDLNSLVKAGSTPLYLVFGNDISSRGEIAAFAFDQSNGEFHAALAIPCNEQHAEVEACAKSTTAAGSETSVRPPLTLPENAREQLWKQLMFGRFGLGRVLTTLPRKNQSTAK